ncbi:hypothetical protein [Blastopirellula retiformator]|nr:hypothetical protein [Blastopirellula retiformator]
MKKVTPQTWIAAALLLLLASPMYGDRVLRTVRRISLLHEYQQALPGLVGQYQLDVDEEYHWCDGSQGRILVFSQVEGGSQHRHVVLTDLDYVSKGAYQLNVAGKLAGVSLIPRIHPVVELVLQDGPDHIRSVHYRLTPHGVEEAYRKDFAAPANFDPTYSDVATASSSPDFSS